MSIFNPNQVVQYINNTGTDATPVKEVSTITCSADAGRFEDSTVTLPATAGATQADYLYLETVDGTSYAVFLDIDEDGTEPTGALYVAADHKITAGIATGDADTAVATKVGAALTGDSNFDSTKLSVTVSDETLLISQKQVGDPTNPPTPKNADDTGAGSISVSVTTAGVASDLNGTSFNIYTGNDRKVYTPWINVNSQGSAPSSPTGTAVEVTLAAEQANTVTATQVAAALNNIENGLYFDATASSNVVTVTNDEPGDATNINDVDTGFTVTVTTAGSDSKIPNPAQSPDQYTNSPSTFT